MDTNPLRIVIKGAGSWTRPLLLNRLFPSGANRFNITARTFDGVAGAEQQGSTDGKNSDNLHGVFPFTGEQRAIALAVPRL